MVTSVMHRTAVNNNKKLYIYIIYLYVFITVKIVPQLNRLFRTAQSAVTIQSQRMIAPLNPLLPFRAKEW